MRRPLGRALRSRRPSTPVGIRSGTCEGAGPGSAASAMAALLARGTVVNIGEAVGYRRQSIGVSGHSLTRRTFPRWRSSARCRGVLGRGGFDAKVARQEPQRGPSTRARAGYAAATRRWAARRCGREKARHSRARAQGGLPDGAPSPRPEAGGVDPTPSRSSPSATASRLYRLHEGFRARGRRRATGSHRGVRDGAQHRAGNDLSHAYAADKKGEGPHPGQMVNGGPLLMAVGSHPLAFENGLPR